MKNLPRYLTLLLLSLLATCCLALQSTAAGAEQDLPLIPRKVFFDNPERARARLSPDGEQLAFIAPVDGVLNVWVGPADDFRQAKPITKDTKRGISVFFWAYTNDHILYIQDQKGDEDYHVYAVDVATKEVKDLTPIDRISARIQEVSEKFPREILVGINDRGERQLHDVYRINIETGERKLIQENTGYAYFITDEDYDVRFAVSITPDGGETYLQSAGADEWDEFMTIDPLDAMTTSVAGFSKDGDQLYLVDARGRDTAVLKTLDLESGESKVLAENDLADITAVLTHPTEKNVEAVTFTYARQQWQVLDESIAEDLRYLQSVADGEIQITSRTLDDTRWTVAYIMDNGPVRFYLYDRNPRKARFLFTSNPELEKLPLANMHPIVLTARDGLKLVCYLTLPPNSDADNNQRPEQPLPMVLLVHGGPWARDSWGYDPQHQLLANRGYAVLSVNFRGSTGFGKKFTNAGNRQWAAAMHDDLIDAVEWAIAERIADKGKVAIMGGSYGGYAALVGLTFTPELFACAVDIVGPSSLVTLLENPPPYWMPMMPVMKLRVGDFSTEEGRKFLESRSPLFYVDKIERPLLIGQGEHDPRVKRQESDQIVEALKEKDVPVVYMLFHDEGHGFVRPENRFAFYAVTEAFLAEHLGGRYEKIGDAFRGANFSIPVGEDGAPGLDEALTRHRQAEPQEN